MTVPSDAPSAGGSTALLLLGGGARAAYQVGVLRGMARRMPDARFPVLVGVSAGAINVAHLASRTGSLSEAADELASLWEDLTPESVMRVDAFSLAKNVLVWGIQLFSGGRRLAPGARSLVDCGPLEGLLRRHLEGSEGKIRGIDANIRSGKMEAVALTTTCYTTADSITFVPGRELPEKWSRRGRIGIGTALSVDHVLASGALPFVFPAVQIGGYWHGDGGVRLSSPLAPAIGLGAGRIVVIPTDSRTASLPPDESRTQPYPPPAEVVGTLFRSHFYDRLNDDLRRLGRINRLLDYVGDGATPGPRTS